MQRSNVVSILRFSALLLAIAFKPALALVKYDEGRLAIMGVQLLQDYSDAKKYYYLPQYPRLAQRVLENGEREFEFLCVKYIGISDNGTEVASGGLLHALI